MYSDNTVHFLQGRYLLLLLCCFLINYFVLCQSWLHLLF